MRPGYATALVVAAWDASNALPPLFVLMSVPLQHPLCKSLWRGLNTKQETTPNALRIVALVIAVALNA
jgi:hypothetical protein